MNENVFRRVEKKYLITESQKKDFLKLIDDYIEKDEYFESHISNIYFDNDKYELITTSIEKPAFKAKVRLRSYNIPDLDDKVFLEIKNKYKGVVGKRRIKIKLSDFYEYLKTGNMKDEQIMKEIDYYFKKYELSPQIFVAYDRLSYKGRDNENIRITIDQNLRSRTNDLRLELGNDGKKYFQDNRCIMEIKILDAYPLWLARSLSNLKIYPTSFSKVGSIYENLKGSEVKC